MSTAEMLITRGEAKGEARGEARGKLEEKQMIARPLKASGMAIAQIAAVCGLSEMEVKGV